MQCLQRAAGPAVAMPRGRTACCAAVRPVTLGRSCSRLIHAPRQQLELQLSQQLAPSTSHPQIRRRRGSVAAAATGGSDGQQDDGGQLYASVGMAALWVGLLAYAFLVSPNQTPYRDQILVKLIVGVTKDDTFTVNQIFFSVFNLLGIYPLVYSCLLIPAARSANKIPAWPFVTLSFGFGAFALLPYFALWRPIKDQNLPLPKEELEGWNRLVMKGAETPVLPGLMLLGALGLFYNAFTAGGDAWMGYAQLLEESRLVHVSSLDFATLTALAPFFMSNDAEARDWKDREKLLPILSFLPVVGPCIYLLLRPKTDLSK